MIKTGRFIVVYDDVEQEVIDPGSLYISKEEIEAYVREHPVPVDPAYSKDDLLYDLTESGGFYRLPDNISDEMRNYVEGMLNALLQRQETR